MNVVSERLGHANPSITLNVYAHVLPSMQQDAVAKIDAVWGGMVWARKPDRDWPISTT